MVQAAPKTSQLGSNPTLFRQRQLHGLDFSDGLIHTKDEDEGGGGKVAITDGGVVVHAEPSWILDADDRSMMYTDAATTDVDVALV